MPDHPDAALLASAALKFVRSFTEAARDSQLRPTFLAWNSDGFVDFGLSSQVLRVAVQHSGINTFPVSTADLLDALRGDPGARSSINQILQRIIARLANEVAAKTRGGHAVTQAIDPDAFRNFERGAHDRLAKSYHALFAPVTEHAAEPLLSAARVRAGSRLLDVACGSGVIAKHAAGRNASVTGIDIAPRMLELAAQLNPGCTFREGSVDSMPFEDGAFDAVVCAFGIGHFPDPPAAAAECARVTGAGGACAFAWWDLPAKNRMHGVLLAAVEEAGAKAPPDLPPGPPMFRYSEDDAFRGLLENAGLRNVKIASHGFTWRLPDAEALWTASMGCMARSSALINSQTPDVRERIHEAFIRHANKYLSASALELPMAFKVCVGDKAKA